MLNYPTNKFNHRPNHKYPFKTHNPKQQILQLLSLKKCIYQYENTIDQIKQTSSPQQANPIQQNNHQKQTSIKKRRKVQPKKTAQAELESKNKAQSQRFLRKREVIQKQKQELLRGSSLVTYNKDKSRLNSSKTKIKLTSNSIKLNCQSKKSQNLIHKKGRTLSNFINTNEQIEQQGRNSELRLKSFIGKYRSKYRCESAKLRQGDIQHRKIQQIVNQLTQQARQNSNQQNSNQQNNHLVGIQSQPNQQQSIIFKNNHNNFIKNNNYHKQIAKQNILRKGGLLKQRYEIVQEIGKGLSGEVFKAKDILSNRLVAIKMSQNREKKQRQYQFYKKVQHKHIINYLNNFIQNGKRYLVLQYLPHTLQTIIKRRKLQQNQIKKIFKYVASAVMYLHGLSIAHRDIKLQNIVCTGDLSVVKFIDFGLCIDLNQSQGQLSKQFCGTVHYMPPEILQLKPYHPKQADIWSLGVLLYKLNFDRFPYRGRDQRQVLQKITRSKLVFANGCSSDLKDVLQSMLQTNVNERASITQVIQHRWLL